MGSPIGRPIPRFRVVLTLAALLACNGTGRAEPAAGFDARQYEQTLDRIEDARRELARQFAAATGRAERDRIRTRARQYVVAAIRDRIFPAWMGTPWGLGKSSTSLRPHQQEMTVGCSYFVTSVLLNAGLRLDSRYRFAQAPALRIQRALAPARADLHRFLSIPAAELDAGIAALGDGLYLIGLNNHIGFVTVTGDRVEIVHASYVAPRVVKVEPVLESPVIENSREAGYFVTPLFSDAGDFLIDHWLAGDAVALEARR